MKSKIKLDEKIIIGTRASSLALTQSRWIKKELKRIFPGLTITLKRIVTSGDRFKNRILSSAGGKGLFIKEIEESLIQGKIDFAVHSMKDLPAKIPDNLTIAAVPKREDSNDVLIWNNKSIPLHKNRQTNKLNGKKILDALPRNATIGTSSLRRQSQLLIYRPDLKVVPLRGNVPTRIRKLKEKQYDGIILAKAGLNRLKLSPVNSTIIPQEIMLPAIGQGALAIECRKKDKEIYSLTRKLNHSQTEVCVNAERAFLQSLEEGGCDIPVAALATIQKNQLILEGLISTPDGRNFVKGKISGKPMNAEKLGTTLGKRLLRKGGKQILQELKSYTRTLNR